MTIKGTFAGWSTQQLQAAEQQIQSAILALATGTKVEAAGYAQGDGTKNVTYTRADLASLNALLQDVRYQLYGRCAARRRPITFTMR